MDAKELPAFPSLEQYKKQAKELVKACKERGKGKAMGAGLGQQIDFTERDFIRRIKKHHPRLGKLSDSEILRVKFALADAQFVIAREYGFQSWSKFSKHIEELTRESSPVTTFETSVEAVINGDIATLERLLRENPGLVRERSMRVHRATLLHYVSANGVEDYRQKTPQNAVAIAKLLLEAGAEVDAPAEMYGGGDTTLGLTATSVHPERAGVQIELLETLFKHGAAIDATGNAVNACLANGRGQAAQFLAQRDGPLDLEGAAGVGRLELVKGFFNDDGSLKTNATKAQMVSGFMWACEYGRDSVVDFLLQKAVAITTQDIGGQTGLHWAATGGQLRTVELLLDRKAPLEVKNIYGATVLDQTLWSSHNDPKPDHAAIIQALVNAGADVNAYPGMKEDLDAALRRVAKPSLS